MAKMHVNQLRILILILLLPLSGFSFFSPTWESIDKKIQEDFPLVKHIEIDELARALDEENILLIDVREADEFAISQIQGARNIQSPEKVNSDEQTRIVVYCSVGYRSALFTHNLQEMGFKNVFNLRGSIFAWANQGYPLYQNGERTNKVHPFNTKWGRLLNEKYHLYPEK